MINKETHKRFWVTLPNVEYEILSMQAKNLNLSVTAYASQIILGFVLGEERSANETSKANRSPAMLNELIMAALKERENDSTFTVKDLFSEEVWKAMSRSEKAIAAKILASIERSKHEIVVDSVYNKTSIYRKEGDISENN